jgi:LacI family transcriptional regulator
MVQVPFVYAYCYPREGVYPSVMYDDEKAARDVTELLIAKGHKRIGALCGPASSYHTQERLKGFKAALAKNGLKANSRLIVYGDWEQPSGYHLSALLMDRGVSAIFSFNDLMASGVYQRAAERGLQIGKDISLFGFDNRDISQGNIPPLSTVEPPLNELGRRCAEIIFSQLQRHRTRRTAGRKRIYLPCSILERSSAATIQQE